MVHKDNILTNVGGKHYVSCMVNFERFDDHIVFCFDTILDHELYKILATEEVNLSVNCQKCMPCTSVPFLSNINPMTLQHLNI